MKASNRTQVFPPLRWLALLAALCAALTACDSGKANDAGQDGSAARKISDALKR